MKQAKVTGKDGEKHYYHVYGTGGYAIYVPLKKEGIPPDVPNPVWGSWEVRTAPGTSEMVPGWLDAPDDWM